MKLTTNDQGEDFLFAPPEKQAQLEDMFNMLAQVANESQRAEKTNEAEKPMPFTIISGFLGAGKTTLLNYLLSADHGLQLTVIVNDFGSINIDASLIRSQDANMISFENGCVCCSSSDQLGDTLHQIISDGKDYDGIILESSGIADPHNTALVALMNNNIKLDSVITLVDCETILEQVEEKTFGLLIKRQIKCADLIVLNKIDLVSSDKLNSIKSYFSITSKARMLEATNGIVPIEILLGNGESSLVDQNNGHIHDHKSFETKAFSINKPIRRDKFIKLISGLPDTILRAKGIVYLVEEPEYQMIFQAVGKRWTLEKGSPWEDKSKHTDLVLIGSESSTNMLKFDEELNKCT